MFLLVSDLDGTLLGGDRRVSKRNQSALQKAKANGGQFAIATGRSLAGAQRFAAPLEARYGILCGGAILYDFEAAKVLSCRTMPAQAYLLGEELSSNFADIGVQIFTMNGVYTAKDHAVFANKGVFEEYSGMETPRYNIPGDWCKLLIVGERVKDVQDHISAYYPGLVPTLSGRQFCEVYSKGVDKGRAVEEVCGIYQLPLGCCAVVGDSENDLSMMEVAGLAMAVENAMPSVKEKANFVLPDHDNHPMEEAVLHAIRYFADSGAQ